MIIKLINLPHTFFKFNLKTIKEDFGAKTIIYIF